MPLDPARLTADWTVPTRVRFGPGRLAELAAACAEAGITRPLLVTGPTLAGGPIVAQAAAILEAAGLAVCRFSALRSNLAWHQIAAGIAAFRAHGADGVVALGGGSALDAGKAIAFQQAQVHDIFSFEDRYGDQAAARLDGIAPVVAVPTTAGSGSDQGRAAVVSHPATGRKVICCHPRMLPVSVILDPLPGRGLSPALTAACGMDALTHCLEAWCARGIHPPADGAALAGLRLIARWLPRAVADGDDVEARAWMLVASGLGAIAFQKGLGAVHALSHPVGSRADAHHGLCNGIFAPYVLAHNAAAAADRLTDLAGLLRLPGPAGGGAVIDWLLRLCDETGIPGDAAGLGIDPDRLDDLAALAVVDPTLPTNPVPLDRAGLVALYRAALAGRLPAPADPALIDQNPP